ncbi:porin, partial [Prochlorococcus marinus str. MU1405]|nr:porin [Prochlorococcus marinus str. MU1405]MBW3047678.1 porin [Prochlorococcus marinus str. MU1406]
MKLFKKLLVAPATLGLLAPLSATANEVTFNDFNPAEELAVTNSRVDGLEARLNNFEAGGFSETTTASFSVDSSIGAIDGDTT